MRWRRLVQTGVLAACFISLFACDSPHYPYFSSIVAPGNTSAAPTAPAPIVLDKDTSIVLYFDSSGPMDALLPVLQAMVATDGPLYKRLSQLYGADYPNKVFIRRNAGEDTLAMLALRDMQKPLPDRCVVFVFQDENDGEDVNVNSPLFQSDMDTLHSCIDSGFLFCRGVVVQVDDGIASSFEAIFKAFESGSAPYEKSSQNLTQYARSDPPKIKVLY